MADPAFTINDPNGFTDVPIAPLNATLPNTGLKIKLLKPPLLLTALLKVILPAVLNSELLPNNETGRL